MQTDHDQIEPAESPAEAPALEEVAETSPDGPVDGPVDEPLDNYHNLKTIWFSPRATVRRIVNTDPTRYVYGLSFLTGIAGAFNRTVANNAGDNTPLLVLLVLICIFGPLGGVVNLRISSFLIHRAGKWIGGTGSQPETDTAIAWGLAPLAFALPLWLMQLLLLGPELFKSEMPQLEAAPLTVLASLGVGLMDFTLTVWAMVLLSNTVAEIQGYRSAWKGFANIVIPFAIILLPLLALGLSL